MSAELGKGSASTPSVNDRAERLMPSCIDGEVNEADTKEDERGVAEQVKAEGLAEGGHAEAIRADLVAHLADCVEADQDALVFTMKRGGSMRRGNVWRRRPARACET